MRSIRYSIILVCLIFVIFAQGYSDEVQKIEMMGGEYYFESNHIIVKVNVPVELRVRKTAGFTPHNIMMRSPEAGMNFRVNLRRSPRIIRFTPTKTGKYPFWCDKKLLFFQSHRDKGMKGIIEVVD